MGTEDPELPLFPEGEQFEVRFRADNEHSIVVQVAQLRFEHGLYGPVTVEKTFTTWLNAGDPKWEPVDIRHHGDRCAVVAPRQEQAA